jgi:hypothetical protein
MSSMSVSFTGNISENSKNEKIVLLNNSGCDISGSTDDGQPLELLFVIKKAE